jgi:type III secretion system FlhB-like substrate exporter
MSPNRGLKAYLAEQANYEKTGLSEPDALVDELIEKANLMGEPLQEKSTVKGLVGTDLRHKMPPQMFAVVSSLAKLIEQVEMQSK